MSIKENIQEELIKRLTARMNEVALIHNQYAKIVSPEKPSYEDGILVRTSDEYCFLKKLSDFVKSI